MYDCIIIGAGAAGLFAAISASERTKRVLVLEKNKMAGRKLRITGKGRCNITNECPFDELIDNIPGNGKFLYSSLTKFSNYDIIDFFNNSGLKTVTERGNRVFPESNQAIDVVNSILAEVRKRNVEIRYSYTVTKIVYDENKVKGVVANGEFFEAKNVIIATGGMSYPGTGSTGDGYRFAKDVGHTVIDPKPSLVPLIASEKWVKDLEGLSLRNVTLSLLTNGNCIYKEFGEMLFTSNGISGPIVLSASRHYLSQNIRDVNASIDLKPALTLEKLDERLIRDFSKYSRKQLKNSLGDLLPSKLIPVFLSRLNIEEEKFVNQITRNERNEIAQLLKNFTLTITGLGAMDEAIITAGGVKVSEINPATLESKLKSGLFFAGEVIDVDGYTGGFNLTIAFSTGYIAGRNIRI